MINIMFCGNDGVFDGVLTCLLSIIKRSELREPLNVYLLTMDVSYLNEKYVPISEGQRAFLEGMLRRYDAQSEVKLIDVTELYVEEFGGSPNEDAYCSPYTLIRLLADRIDSIPDKLLYLDVDIMFNGDVHLLYDIDVSEVEYAAARDHYGKFLVSPNYVNAGVLLLNLDYMRKTGILTRARALLRQKKLPFADQSALIRSTEKKKMIAQRFNDQKFLHKHTVVRHFSKRLFWFPYPHTENIKQWQINEVHKVFGYNQFDDIFEEYINLKESFERGDVC